MLFLINITGITMFNNGITKRVLAVVVKQSYLVFNGYFYRAKNQNKKFS